MAGRMVRAALVEIDPKTGAQKYQVSTDPEEVIYLCGWNRADGVKIGDTGYLSYRSTKTFGLYFFEKDK